MKIPCDEISAYLAESLRQKAQTLISKNLTPKLVTILVGSSPEQLSFVRIKRRTAAEIGVIFELVHLPEPPSFEEFKSIISRKAHEPETTGMIIQQPFPDVYDIPSVYRCISPEKEIEGHHPESKFHFPLSLAVLSGIKYIIAQETGTDPISESIVNIERDRSGLHTYLRNKIIVIAGRGATGGNPISRMLDSIGIPHLTTHSRTKNPERLYKNADIIITATGKHIIHAETVKKDVILLNVGLRKEDGKLKGDYDEDDIASHARYYTVTPGGLGPLDVLYLFKNVIDAQTASLPS